MVRDMAEEKQSAAIDGENDADLNDNVEENGELEENGIDEDLDDSMFYDPEGFVDQISDEGLCSAHLVGQLIILAFPDLLS